MGRHRILTEDQITEAVTLHARGLSFDRIATRMQCSPRTIADHVHQRTRPKSKAGTGTITPAPYHRGSVWPMRAKV